MIRFVDLSEVYWTDPERNGGPICAFLDTTTNHFVGNEFEEHVFGYLDEVEGHPQAERLLALLPEGFFSKEPA